MERVALVGTGLIGGSIGLGLARIRPDVHVAGYDRAAGSLERALERGAVTTRSSSPAAAVEGADLVVLAVPGDQLEDVAGAVRETVHRDAVITDVASAKAGAVAVGHAHFGDRFIGGHPMAGSERHGIEAADAELFQDAAWILTPTSETSSAAYSAAADLAVTLGSRIVAVDPAEHDALVARLSHVPQLMSSALVDVAVGSGGPGGAPRSRRGRLQGCHSHRRERSRSMGVDRQDEPRSRPRIAGAAWPTPSIRSGR